MDEGGEESLPFPSFIACTQVCLRGRRWRFQQLSEKRMSLNGGWEGLQAHVNLLCNTFMCLGTSDVCWVGGRALARGHFGARRHMKIFPPSHPMKEGRNPSHFLRSLLALRCA